MALEPGRVQALKFALGSAHQTNVSTISPTFNLWRKLNMDVPYLLNGTETDEEEIGKGNEFISQVFKTNVEPAPARIEKYGSAEFMAWAWAYALGNVGLSAGLYTIHPIDPTVTLELPYFTIASQYSAGNATVFDEAMIGCVVESVTTEFHYGPTRASVKTTVEYMGAGISTIPSGVTYPSTPLSENYMLSSSMAISLLGVDLVSAETALMGTISWKNNMIAAMRYTPGSGLDANGFAVGNRIFIGRRVPTLTVTALMTSASAEYAALVAQTTGSCTITFTFDATHFVTFTFNVISFRRVTRAQEEGLVAVEVTVAPHYDPTQVGGIPNNVVVVTSKNAISDIAQ